MKQILLFLVTTTFCLSAYSQHKTSSIVNTPKKVNTFNQFKSTVNTVVDSADIIWYENFREGLDGNNNSFDPSWTTQGSDGAIWELDFDGSNGDYAGNEPFLLESESADNGWMIFDADGSNAGLPTAAYSNRKGSLTSPYIDLSNDSNVTLSFEHAYRWCCSGSHELTVFINNGSGWSAANSFQVNDLGTINILSGTVNVEIIITEMAALNDSVQIRFDWANDAETASHYFWMIDDVKIIKTQAYSSNILTSYNNVPSTYFGGTSYRVMPFEQISQTAYFFGGILENVGYNTLDSVRIDAYVESEGFNTESYGYTIESGSRDTMFVNDGFTPADTGVYFGSITGKDDNNYITTDTLTQRFQVTEYVYARDNGNNVVNFGSFGINGDGNRQYGNVFDIYKTSTAYAVTIRLSDRTTPTATGKIVINTIDPNTGDVSYLTETEVLDLGSQTEEWFDVVLDPPVLLDAGQVVLPTLYAEYNSTDTVYISTSGSNPNNGESIVQDIDGIQEGVDPGAWLYTTFAPCLRLNFDPSVTGINTDVNERENNLNFAIYPNPNKGVFKVQLDLQNTANIVLEVKSILGKSVYKEEINNSGMINKSLDLSYLKKGIYFISITDDSNSISTKKITIQ
ncbi:MAG: T9SS type A sorting domain-containing protein [Flavobacteriales bacterium]|nr:T9SS type A sorting domain-containing protein [Flavobacteriales bacterium]